MRCWRSTSIEPIAVLAKTSNMLCAASLSIWSSGSVVTIGGGRIGGSSMAGSGVSPHGWRLSIFHALVTSGARRGVAAQSHNRLRTPWRFRCSMNCAWLRPGNAANHLLRSLVVGCKRLLSERGETNSMAIARQLVERIDMLPEEQLGGFFDYLAQQLGPDPQQVLRAAQAYADRPDAQRQIALTQAAEPPRQELLRRLNRTPGGTGTLVRMRRALLHRLPRQPELMGAGGRPAAPVQLMVQPRLPADAARGLELARQAAGKDHPPRGGARDRRLGRPAPAAAAGPTLLCLLPPATARRAADLRRGGAAAGDAAGHRAADRQGLDPAGAGALRASPRSTASATASRGCATCRWATS